MTTENFVYWLQGFIEDRKSLTEEEVNRISQRLGMVIDMPAPVPTRAQIENMVKKLFPDLAGDDLRRQIEVTYNSYNRINE